MKLRKLPIGLQDFAGLRHDGFLYVDKTQYIHMLVHTGKQYFLSRPRRFGKSLFLSALSAYWSGQKELFDGLSIEKMEENNPDAWIPHPVFYIDFNRDDFQKDASLEGILEAHLEEWEDLYGCTKKEASQPVRFQNLLRRAAESTGHRCVILVDEYDKPLLEALGNPFLEEHNTAVYKGFFSTLKSYDKYLRFVFITGVTKFSKVSIFSDLNQLEDISLDEDYAGICGITEKELHDTFAPEIRRMAESQGLSDAQCAEKLQASYDGYHFSSSETGVYNPHSLLNALKKRKYGSYWFETGTPTFLVKLLRTLNFDLRSFSNHSLMTTESVLADYRTDNPDPVPLLYQTGYLTIQNYDQRSDLYTLGFPNQEVEYGFLKNLLPEYVSDTGTGSGKDILSIRSYLESADLDSLRDALTALFAGIPYTQNDAPFENYFQAVIYIVFTLLGQYTHCEVHSFKGRADCIVETSGYVYLFEFKRDRTAGEALKQILDMGYALPYLTDSRKVYLIGAAFDSTSRMLVDWEAVDK